MSIKQKRGNCTGKDGKFTCCGREDVPIITSRGHCNYCSNKWKQEQKKSSTKKVNQKSRLRKPTGELAMFLEIWMEREHKCEHCGKPLYAFKVHYFDHIKPKGSYPELRLVKSNIQLLCYYYDEVKGWYGCHHLKTFGTKEEFNNRKGLHI